MSSIVSRFFQEYLLIQCGREFLPGRAIRTGGKKESPASRPLLETAQMIACRTPGVRTGVRGGGDTENGDNPGSGSELAH